MNLKQLSSTILLSCLAAIAGYYSGALRQAPASYSSADARLSVDDLYAPQSFSEVENTKALLTALSQQVVTEIQAERLANHAKAALSSRTGEPVVEPDTLAVIQKFERSVVEFEGTEQELYLVQPFLAVLKTAKLYDRWIDVYLNALYQHPTHAMIGRLAAEALLVSKATGRQGEVLNAFEHVSRIPLKFGLQAQIRTELVNARTEGLVAAH
jgi:hypothetical protein